jgi:hypothetical protein
VEKHILKRALGRLAQRNVRKNAANKCRSYAKENSIEKTLRSTSAETFEIVRSG